MTEVEKNVVSNLFGTKGQVGVSRGIAEFHAGRPVLVTGGGETLLTLPIEGLDARRLAEFTSLCASALPRLVITARRALALGIAATTPMALPLAADFDVDAILTLVADRITDRSIDAKPVGPAAIAAIQLVKLSQGLPAVLVANVAVGDAVAAMADLVTVEAEAVARFGDELVQSLMIANKASVPLGSSQRACFYVFRDALGGSQVAVVVGAPDFAEGVLVRLHSACLTGDVFGSRRCDCGDQLKLALKQIEDSGGGVVLYLAQEGRGLGLSNKMRTYQMQDDGLDTIDANTTLGFDNDERDYGMAARMLQLLGCNRVVLLTNNPVKLEGLAKSGIEVLGRMALEAPINSDNYRYMTAKATRAGHLLHHHVPPISEPWDA
jgi:GTP cyclohydrolase II